MKIRNIAIIDHPDSTTLRVATGRGSFERDEKII